MNSTLSIIVGLDKGKTISLEEAGSSFVMGRGDTSQLVLLDPGVSREHALLVRRKERWVLSDMSSRNGTFLNNLPVKNEIELSHQDVISLGSVELLFTAQAGSATPQKEITSISGSLNTTDAFGLSKRLSNSIVGQSQLIKDMLDQIYKLSLVDASVLVHGETGTGKELVARALHAGGDRGVGPFVAVNCAAIPDTLFESEFFGHEKGAFTGAQTGRQGYFEQANGGTIFLDEIGDLPLDAQAKLLRVLEARTIRRVGGNDDMRVDVRVVAATHRSLEKLVKSEKFREDLYHRLRVIEISIPSLKDRLQDLPLLCDHFMTRLSHESSRKETSISKKGMKVLASYDWPGNVRELRNVLERAMILAGDEVIGPEHLTFIKATIEVEFTEESFPTLKSFEHEQAKKHVQKALVLTEGNKSKAAKLLGISRPVLYEKLKSYKLD